MTNTNHVEKPDNLVFQRAWIALEQGDLALNSIPEYLEIVLSTLKTRLRNVVTSWEDPESFTVDEKKRGNLRQIKHYALDIKRMMLKALEITDHHLRESASRNKQADEFRAKLSLMAHDNLCNYVAGAADILLESESNVQVQEEWFRNLIDHINMLVTRVDLGLSLSEIRASQTKGSNL